MTSKSSINNPQGTYELARMYDENGTLLEIPSRSNNGGFQMIINNSLESKNDDDNIGGNESDDTTKYTVAFKLGNVLRTQMTIMDSPGTNNNKDDTTPVTVEFGPVISTRMLPPPEIYKLEVTASQHIFGTKPCHIQYDPATALLSIISTTTQGKIECRRIQT